MGHITCVRGVGSPVTIIICHGWENVNLVFKIAYHFLLIFTF